VTLHEYVSDRIEAGNQESPGNGYGNVYQPIIKRVIIEEKTEKTYYTIKKSHQIASHPSSGSKKHSKENLGYGFKAIDNSQIFFCLGDSGSRIEFRGNDIGKNYVRGLSRSVESALIAGARQEVVYEESLRVLYDKEAASFRRHKKPSRFESLLSTGVIVAILLGLWFGTGMLKNFDSHHGKTNLHSVPHVVRTKERIGISK
jgi:hypothetical protein